jgi:hypothetical protein
MSVLLCSHIDPDNLKGLLARYGMHITRIASNEPVPGSFWKEPEAGLVGNVLYVRDDTPVHSALHEASHYICMDPQRRDKLDTDAGGGYEEENGVCYLQILLAERIPEMGRERMFSDMDDWGYSFRLGSSRAWFEDDAEDAVAWLRQYGLIDHNHQPAWQLRQKL